MVGNITTPATLDSVAPIHRTVLYFQFLVAAVTVLLSLSWVGSYLNGFFAAWALTLALLMIPGLKKNGALDKIIQLALSKAKMH